MRRSLAAALLTCCAARAQNQAGDAAARFRALLEATPKLGVEQVPLTAQLTAGELMGTVSSLAAGRDGTIYVLQRGDKANPVIAIDTQGKVLRSWGKGMFTVPHSVRIDPEGNVWTVDAGNSVLQKFTPEGKKLQEISVGEVAPAERCAFPTLCGTTDVSFGPGGRLFISDGYGNARILIYDAEGRRVKTWGSSGTGPSQFQIPHGIANDGRTIYVADRTNARIQRFDLDGKYLGEWTHLGRPFALKFAGGALWAAGMTLETAPPQGQATAQTVRAQPWLLKIDPQSGKLLGQIQGTGPHSIDVNAAEELYSSGCCGGSNPAGFSWFRRTTH